MSWMSAIYSLIKQHGNSARFASTTVLSTLIPGGAALTGLVEKAFDVAEKQAQDHWEQSLLANTQATANDVTKLGQVLQVLTTDLGQLTSQVAALNGQPRAATRTVDEHLADGLIPTPVLTNLSDLAGGLEIVQAQNRQLLAGQDEMLPLLRRSAGVADFVAELRSAGLDGIGFAQTLQQMRTALAALAAGRWQEAETNLNAVAVAQPQSAVAQVALAAVEAAQHDLPAAQAALTKAVRMRPRDAELQQVHSQMTRALGGTTPSAPKPTPPGPQVGQVLDGWTLEARLGAGGWGQVFRARRGNDVQALKVMHPNLASDPAFVERFKDEILLLASLKGQSPHLVGIHKFGYAAESATWYFVMEFIDGVTLEQYLSRKGPLSELAARTLLTQLATGLATAHAKGIVHRDIKPANILLQPNTLAPVLVDFGLAGAVDAQQTRIGGHTALFAAPEQLRGKPGDARSDVYALAGTVYYALCYDRPTVREPGEFDAQQVPANLRTVLSQALDAKPDRRFAHAEALRQALAPAAPVELLEVIPTVPPPPAPKPQPKSSGTRKRIAQRPTTPVPPTPERTKTSPVVSRTLAGCGVLAFVVCLGILGCGVYLFIEMTGRVKPYAPTAYYGVPQMPAIPKMPAMPTFPSPHRPQPPTERTIGMPPGMPNTPATSLNDKIKQLGGRIETDGRTNQLVGVDFSNTSITEANLEVLRSATWLRKLNLSGTSTTTAGLKPIATLHSIEELRLDRTRIDSNALQGLHLVRLRVLSLAHTAVDDVSLIELRKCDQLENLNLTGTQVTDAGLRQLYSLTKLVMFNTDQTKVTPAGRADFESKRQR